jgi:hypothetical protein
MSGRGREGDLGGGKREYLEEEKAQEGIGPGVG